MFRKKQIFLVVLIFFIFFIKAVFADENLIKTELETKIAQYQEKLSSLQKQKNSLSSQIKYMDTQTYLTGLKIQETTLKVNKTTKEIETLGSRITGLDNSLDHLSKLLIQKIVAGYKHRRASFFDLVFESTSAEKLINELKYRKTVREKNQQLLLQTQAMKSNFEEQKTLREEKIKELDNLKTVLDKQKASLFSQKKAKQNLLQETKSSETVYQRLLAQAKAQISAFTSFVQSSGVGSIIGANAFGSGSDGAYFSQRDARWGYQTIGNSSENILRVGCLLTTVSMVLKKNGIDVTPSTIASNSNYFSLNTAYMKFRNQFNPWYGKLNNYRISISQVDDELSQGHYVIVGINYGGGCKTNSDHFVVLTKKEGNDYIMHDPLYGPDLKFSSHYSTICKAEVFK